MKHNQHYNPGGIGALTKGTMKDIFLGKLWSTHQGRYWHLRPGKWRQELGFPASGSSTRRGECCQVWDRSCLSTGV
ncbi:MAG: hypothetical protein GY699_21840 [Desulfobacteraceae bacterium]|nr:hypothetical protein [Desulfobacteraceae bacterium]